MIHPQIVHSTWPLQPRDTYTHIIPHIIDLPSTHLPCTDPNRFLTITVTPHSVFACQVHVVVLKNKTLAPRIRRIVAGSVSEITYEKTCHALQDRWQTMSVLCTEFLAGDYRERRTSVKYKEFTRKTNGRGRESCSTTGGQIVHKFTIISGLYM